MVLSHFYSKTVLFVLLSLINAVFVQSNLSSVLQAGTKSARNDPCLAIEGGLCQNSGICYVDSSDKFACHCRYGYIGDYCELPSCTYDYGILSFQ